MIPEIKIEKPYLLNLIINVSIIAALCNTNIRSVINISDQR